MTPSRLALFMVGGLSVLLPSGCGNKLGCEGEVNHFEALAGDWQGEWVGQDDYEQASTSATLTINQADHTVDLWLSVAYDSENHYQGTYDCGRMVIGDANTYFALTIEKDGASTGHYGSYALAGKVGSELVDLDTSSASDGNCTLTR